MKSYNERIEIVRKIAQKLSNKHHLSPPVDVFALAEKENLRIQYEGNQMGIDGAAKLNADPPIITLNSEQTYQPRVRFTLAHEIGHVKIPWHTGVKGCSTDDPYVQVQAKKQVDSQELEANAFASEILIPREWLRQKIDMIDDFPLLLEQITRETGASTMACFYALENVLPSGHIIYITAPSMSYWKSFQAENTYTWSAGWQNKFEFLDATCLKYERFEWGSYVVCHYFLQPCPDPACSAQAYQLCSGDLGELLNALTDYHPERILHCLDTILLSLPDQFVLFMEPYSGEEIVFYCTPKCYISLPARLEGYEELRTWVIESHVPYGEITLAGGKRLFWAVQPVYSAPPFRRRDSKRLLRQLIDKYYPAPEAAQILYHINGVIGSANSRSTAGREELFHQIRARFSQDEQVRVMIDDPDFDSFIDNRVREIIARRPASAYSKRQKS